MMRVLITGAKGQLGRECVQLLAQADIDVIGIDVDDLDLLDLDRVPGAIARYEADWVIHCAAFTQVDRAESDSDVALRVNRDAAQAVASGVHQSNGRMVYISTDFVFGGDRCTPYTEQDTPEPLSVYGRSKWQGEQAVLEVLPEALVVRTGWVYGVHGHNFVKTILKLAMERERLNVVDDQVGTPTWTFDLAQALLDFIKTDVKGIVHFTNEGVASWYDFATQILSVADRLRFHLKVGRITPIPSAEYPTPARRPAYSVLSKLKARALLKRDIPHWRESLSKMMQELDK